MKGDFTRSTFRPEKHYSSVRMQQGRLQLDADWNEQVDIQNHANQAQANDVIGSSGASKTAFEITPDGTDLKIAPGHIYVDGILCELEEQIIYSKQLDHPNALNADINDNLEAGKIYLAYLDVWQRHITALEDPEIREVALSISDTTTRTKRIWQVKLAKIELLELLKEAFPNDEFPDDEQQAWQQKGRAAITQIQQRWKNYIAEPKTKQSLSDRKAYLTANTKAGYQGLENQLYRVEIHTPGKVGTATFKWSRDNGMVVSAVKSIEGKTIIVRNPGRDAAQSFAGGQWVEIIDEEQELNNQPGTLAQLTGETSGNKLVVNIDLKNIANKSKLKVRRWDNPSSAEILTNSTGSELEYGITVQFENDSNDPSFYNTGDYWLIPARAVNNSIEWPHNGSNQPLPEPPHGIRHHYCPLALLKYDNNQFTLLKDGDCRNSFPSLVNCLDKTADYNILTGKLEIQNDLYVTGKGKVGIGTTSPKGQLQINIDEKDTVGQIIRAAASQSSNLQEWQANEGNPLTVVAANGAIGIGIATPKQQLVVAENSQVGIGYNESSQTASLAVKGRVGIGTFTPQQQLVLSENSKVGIGYNESTQTAALAVKGFVGIGTFTPQQQLVLAETSQVGIGYNESTQTAALAVKGFVGIGTFTPQQQLVLAETSKVSIGYNESSQTAALAVKGFVGIGTFTPQQQLVLAENSKVGIGYNESSQTAALAVNGRVGIGITSPTAGLDVRPTLTATKDQDNLTALRIQPNFRDEGKIGVKHYGLIVENAKVRIGTSIPEEQFVVNNGKVGIGYNTENLSAALAVNGLVGIGTASPSAGLDVRPLLKATTDGDTLTALHIQANFQDEERTGVEHYGLIVENGKVRIGTSIPEEQFVVNNSKVGIGYNTKNQSAALAVRGLVGIGTINPSAGLDVQPLLKATTNGDNLTALRIQANFQDEGRTGVQHYGLIVDNGKVRFGTSVPEEQFVVNNGKVSIGYNDSQQTATLAMNGLMGIGTTRPTAGLDVRPTLIATQDGQRLTALHIEADFKDNEKSDVESYGLVVENKIRVNDDLWYKGKLLQDSSRELKENIIELSSQEVTQTLKGLNPVKFTYKGDDKSQLQVGFISEDVPELVASSDKKAVSHMEIVAILTQAVKEHRKTIQLLTKVVREQQEKIATLEEKINSLEN
ncbi:MAG TPA: DUF6519 domain-containing protein [Waterburya sp.]|jgi:hypothetical protein